MDRRRSNVNHRRLQILIRSMIVGGISSGIKKTTIAPLERIKIVLQTHPKSVDKPFTKGIFGCTKHIWNAQPEGSSFIRKPISFYRGNLTRCLNGFPSVFLGFLFRGTYKNMLFKRGKYYSAHDAMMRYLLAGGLAGVSTLLFLQPLILTATRLSSDVSAVRSHRGIINCLSSTIKNEGILGLYKGFVPLAIGSFIYRACYFGFYDIAKKMFETRHPGKTHSFLFYWSLAQSTTLLTQYCVYPIQTVAYRMQTSGDSRTGSKPYKGSLDCLKKIVSEEGFFALYQGAWMNLIKSVTGALLLVTFDILST